MFQNMIKVPDSFEKMLLHYAEKYEQQRKRFEAWYKTRWENLPNPEFEWAIRRSDDGTYTESRMQIAWESWCASLDFELQPDGETV